MQSNEESDMFRDKFSLAITMDIDMSFSLQN